MDDVQRAAEAIAKAKALLLTAGAGMGVDSGLPDFRGDEGFWKAYPPFRERGLRFVDLASPTWFEDDPELAWGFYGHRLELYRRTVPHRGFEILRGKLSLGTPPDGRSPISGSGPIAPRGRALVWPSSAREARDSSSHHLGWRPMLGRAGLPLRAGDGMMDSVHHAPARTPRAAPRRVG